MIKFRNFLESLVLKVQEDRTPDGAAVLAYYLTLATFPAITTLIATLPFLPIDGLQDFLLQLVYNSAPGNTGEYIANIIHEVLSNKKPALLSIGVLGTLWAASSGMVAVIVQLNLAYNVKKERSFLKRRLVAIGLTFFYVLTLMVIGAIVILGQEAITWLGFAAEGSLLEKNLTLIFRYFLAYSLLLFAFASIYYLAPNSRQKFKYITPGTFIGASFIILATMSFNYYIKNHADYSKTYGSLGGVVVYMVWIYIAGFVLLFSAQINEILKNQSKLRKDHKS
jgi:membrane protein